MLARAARGLTAGLVAASTLGACGGADSRRSGDGAEREIGDPVVVAEGSGPSGREPVEQRPDVDELDGLPEAGVGGGRSCGSVDDQPTAASLSEVADTILCLVNAERTRRGLSALQIEARLTRASRDHADDMVRKVYFAHDSRDGRSVLDRIKATGYLGRRGGIVGENLGWGSGIYSTPQSLVDGWMASPGHRANILQRRYRHIGIGVILGSPRRRGLDDAVTVATDFGRRGGALRR